MTDYDRRCPWCRHFVVREGIPLCERGHKLIPCSDYEREPGADDDREDR